MSRKTLRILLACENTTNPFIRRLRTSLDYIGEDVVVDQNINEFWDKRRIVDIVHIHWPHALFKKWRRPTPEKLEELERCLEYWSTESSITSTVHNIVPHYDDTYISTQLYNIVYKYTDGFIHMGKASVGELANAYSVDNKDHVVIPHGCYDGLENTVSQARARSRLGIGENAVVVLVLGSLRDPEELSLVLEATRRWGHPQRLFLVAGRFQWTTNRLEMHASRWYQRVRTFWDPIQFYFGRFPDEQLQYFLNGADILFVARKHILNSGDVPLGFTFGRVVVGPNVGVVGEVLRDTGNPTFDPTDPKSLAPALQEGIRLQENGKGVENARYARKNLNWKDIAEQHISFYKRVINQKDSPSR